MPYKPATVRQRRHSTPVVRYQYKPSEPAKQHRRALATNSAAWRKIRAGVLQAEPLCRICAAKRRITAASCVDHINGDAMDNDRMNLQPLCSRCHSRKTAAENGGFGNPRGKP